MAGIAAAGVFPVAKLYACPRSWAIGKHALRQQCYKMSSRPHLDRTAAEPRQDDLHKVILTEVAEINPSIRLLSLTIVDQIRGVQFLPGQWLDVHLPGVDKVGGFTITSAPALAIPGDSPAGVRQISKDEQASAGVRRSSNPRLELAVQRSANNPPAAWFWRPKDEIIESPISVRVGGSFVWPPSAIEPREITRLVLIAGGVGINPMMSILSHLHTTHSLPQEVVMLYSSKAESGPDLSKVLFIPRLLKILDAHNPKMKLALFVTNLEITPAGRSFDLHHRRINRDDLIEAVGDVDTRNGTVCYVCGPSKMADEIVGVLGELQGMHSDRILCERWW